MKNNSKHKCILFAGAPGSSKTPVAYYLSWNLGLPIFNNDAIRREVAEDTLRRLCSEDPEFAKRQRERIDKLFRSQKSFIYDRSVDRTWDNTRSTLEKYDFQYFLISFNLSQEFIRDLGQAKGYPDNELNARWYKDHTNFLERYSSDIDLVIDEKNFDKRLLVALEAAEKFLGSTF